ncbi:abc transporter substrate-binding protein [hydrocarbon metagenome]|uniref:Abc transporter substrate-binding protein n=1 Tax=hydrocarbon metagenome TaxID=938273 RepID=A0A0W8E2C6_9ZZZZ
MVSKNNKVYNVTRIMLVGVLICCLVLVGCGGQEGSSQPTDTKDVLTLADASWDSIKVHNRIVGFIVEHGYGYPTPEYIFGDTLPLLQGTIKGDVDIYMEVWADNIKEAWETGLTDGTVKDLGPNLPDGPQGWWVPTYMIEGDSERGIEPITPNLKSVSDLPQYWELFKDREVPTKGRFHNSPPGWICTDINEVKMKTYGLEDTFNVFSTGSDAALVTSMVTAYEKGEPWLGYYWEPTWVMGKLDMTMLEEPTYDDAIWNDESNRGCAYPPALVLVGINSGLEEKAPEIVEFLDNYETTLAQNNEFLAYMNDYEGENSEEAAAIYFLITYPEVWEQWVPEDIAAKVNEALKEVK